MGVDSQGQLAEVVPVQFLMRPGRVFESVGFSELHVKRTGGDQGVEPTSRTSRKNEPANWVGERNG